MLDDININVLKYAVEKIYGNMFVEVYKLGKNLPDLFDYVEGGFLDEVIDVGLPDGLKDMVDAILYDVIRLMYIQKEKNRALHPVDDTGNKLMEHKMNLLSLFTIHCSSWHEINDMIVNNENIDINDYHITGDGGMLVYDVNDLCVVRYTMDCMSHYLKQNPLVGSKVTINMIYS